MANYSQPDFRNPAPNPLPTVQPVPVGGPVGNPLNLNSAQITDFVQPGTNALGVEILKPPPKGVGILVGN